VAWQLAFSLTCERQTFVNMLLVFPAHLTPSSLSNTTNTQQQVFTIQTVPQQQAQQQQPQQQQQATIATIQVPVAESQVNRCFECGQVFSNATMLQVRTDSFSKVKMLTRTIVWPAVFKEWTARLRFIADRFAVRVFCVRVAKFFFCLSLLTSLVHDVVGVRVAVAFF